MKILLVTIFLFISCSYVSSAQILGDVHIYVFKGKDPLQDATVKLRSKNFRTNLAGEVKVVFERKDTIMISYLGFKCQQILVDPNVQDTLFVHMAPDDILLDEVQIKRPISAKILLRSAYKKMVQHNNLESYILQYMGQDNHYVKVTEASAYIHIPEINGNVKDFDKNSIRLGLNQVVERMENGKTNAKYHFDFRSLLYRAFTTEQVIDKIDNKKAKSELTVKQDDKFWLIETPDPLEFNNTHYIFKWIINKSDTTLLQTRTIVNGEKSSNTYVYDFITNEESTCLYKAHHSQLLSNGKRNYSGGLEMYVLPSKENMSSIISIDCKDYDFSKIKRKAKINSETLDDFKVRLGIPTIKFD